jgi:hypothetical protein
MGITHLLNQLNLQFRIFIHAEEAPCDKDSKFISQNFPGQICQARPEFGGRLIYAFPVSYYSGQASSNDRRRYNQIENLSKYNMKFDEIISSAILNQKNGKANWNSVNFPIRESQYMITSPVCTI